MPQKQLEFFVFVFEHCGRLREVPQLSTSEARVNLNRITTLISQTAHYRIELCFALVDTQTTCIILALVSYLIRFAVKYSVLRH